MRSGRPRGPGQAPKLVGGVAPHLSEGLPGPPVPARPQKDTPKKSGQTAFRYPQISHAPMCHRRAPYGSGAGYLQRTCDYERGDSKYIWFFYTLFLGRPEVVDFGGLGGPGGPNNHAKIWRLCPSYFCMVSRAPGAAQTPKIDDFRPAQKSCIKNLSVEWRPIDGQTYRRANPAKPCNLLGFVRFARR